ncbi:carbonic anhydrase 4-like [Cottoperca gobio]|uniref:Carbonic anhydrase n=1 Tax=Cottoperca gobio TaxID=56716 RepID=A0A6J2RPG7_COTGO|nr:carbonic anhydrase 4-like [Cottoperca gobio]XP_029312808.1 carbonic anhydrase 4-like [Cottoperca gobio]
MKWLLTALTAVCVLLPSAHCATPGVVWCYDQPSCNESRWGTIAPLCSGSRQSPINIVSTSATADSNLTEFTFTNYNSKTALTMIENTGKTVKVSLAAGVKISGGGLPESYDSLQFHLHWGNGSSVPGSEHTVNGKRYSMELHIVNSKGSYNTNTALAVKDSTGLAALGFFIEEMSGSSTGQPASWNILSSYLASIKSSGNKTSVANGISLDDLLTGVDRSKYYRYLGSLTTPTCNEAVVWTVFKDTIKVSRDVIDLFSNTVHVGDENSTFAINVFRSIQPLQDVSTQAGSSSSNGNPSSSSSASSGAMCSVGLMALSLVLGRGVSH